MAERCLAAIVGFIDHCLENSVSHILCTSHSQGGAAMSLVALLVQERFHYHKGLLFSTRVITSTFNLCLKPCPPSPAVDLIVHSISYGSAAVVPQTLVGSRGILDGLCLSFVNAVRFPHTALYKIDPVPVADRAVLSIFMDACCSVFEVGLGLLPHFLFRRLTSKS